MESVTANGENRITWDKAYEAKIFHLQAHFLTIGGAQLDRGKCGADEGRRLADRD